MLVHNLQNMNVTREFDFITLSLRRRVNPAPVSNVWEAAPITLLWATDALNELPEVRFEYLFNLIGKSTMGFLTRHSWRVLKSWYTGGYPKQGFRRRYTDELNQAPVVQTLDSTIQRISIRVTNCAIHRIEISPVDSVIYLLNN